MIVSESRRSPRSRRPVETLDYLAAARRFIRAAGRRVADSDEAELAALLELREEVDRAVDVAVAGMRARGLSWTWIGQGVGMTRQAARQRWGQREAPQGS